MGNILEKARLILRNVYMALGATAMPVLIHAMYGMRQPDPASYTVPVQGRVVSEETGGPVAGITVRYDHYVPAATAATGNDGSFLIYVPEGELYAINFYDFDGFENGGFFSYKQLRITRDETSDPLEVILYRESQVSVIRGTVCSVETGEPVPGIRVNIGSNDGYNNESEYTPFSGFSVLSDNDGQFYIQVPERDTYFIYFSDDTGLFQFKQMQVTSEEIKRKLKVDLEQRAGENGQ